MGKAWSVLKGGKDIAPRKSVLVKLDRILTEKFPNEEFSYEIEKASGKGDNYSGVLYRVTVKFSNDKTFQLILKNASENVLRRILLIWMHSYKREALAYNEYLPLIVEFQQSKALPDDVIFKAFPQCYGMLDREYAIFLEDMCFSGYKMFDRFQEMDVTHTNLIIMAYAKFHALSFALKDQAPEKILKFTQLENLAKKMNNPIFRALFNKTKDLAIDSINDEADANYKQKLLNYLGDNSCLELFAICLEGNQDTYSVVCHGDSWNNNLLFKYDDKSNPIDVVIIDFQQLRYCSPIAELMYYLWTNTTGDFRRQHYNDTLELYHKTLSDHLRILGSDVNKLFPYEVFKQELHKFGYSGLLFAMFMLPNLTTRPEDMPEVNEIFKKGMTHHIKDNDQYKKRMRDVIVDIINYGYI